MCYMVDSDEAAVLGAGCLQSTKLPSMSLLYAVVRSTNVHALRVLLPFRVLIREDRHRACCASVCVWST